MDKKKKHQAKSFKRQETFKELTIGTLHRIRYIRAGKELGFSIVGGVDYAYGGIYVNSITDDTNDTSVADKGAGLLVGDRILSINNMGLFCITKEEADKQFETMPSDFLILVLRLGTMQWNMLRGKVEGKGQMRTPGPFFKPYCRGANLPLMDGVHSTHGEIEYFKLSAAKGALGLRLMCFGRFGLVPNSKETGCMFISEINPQGLAHQMPGITVGARLLEINGHCLLSSSQNIFAYRVKQCHMDSKPIELVLQILDPQQWRGLKKALAAAGTGPAVGARDSLTTNDRAQRITSIATQVAQQKASLNSVAPTEPVTRTPSSNTRRLSELVGGLPKPASNLKRTPSMQERQALMNAQRTGGGTPVKAPVQPKAPVLRSSQSSQSKPLVLAPSDEDLDWMLAGLDTLQRARPSAADKMALLNMQKPGSSTKQPPPVQSPRQSAQPNQLQKARPSQADRMALLKSQNSSGSPQQEKTNPSPPPATEETSNASVMKQMGEMSVRESVVDEDDDEAQDMVGGFGESSRQESTIVEDVVVDEDEDGNKFLTMEMDQSDVVTRIMTLKEFNLPKYENLTQRLPLGHQMPPGVKNLNRYINILPTPKTRVKLPQIGMDATTNYINANYIGSWDERNKKAYILCQAPTPTMRGAADFWRMVWDNNVKAIIMATGITEGGVEKCVRYWPSRLYDAQNKIGEGTYHVQSIPGYPSITVKVTDGFRKDGYITSKFLIQQNGSPAREVRHYWFDSWPDHGVPQRVEPLIAMIKAARAYTAGHNAPWLVHCSAGIGRSGTVVAVDWGLHQLQESGSADVVDIVDRMRNYRGGLVQHGEQARFVHTCLSRFAVAQGSLVVLSVMEEEVLEDSIEKAMQSVPDEMGVHHSQVDGDEGSEEQVPRWRMQQITKIKAFHSTGIAEDIEDLKLTGETQIANRRARREDAKRQAQEKSAESAMAKMNELLNITDEPKKFIASTATLGKRGTNRKKISLLVNVFQAGNQRHGSVYCGKLNAQQYATLDGDFHLDSSLAGDLE